MRDSLFAWVAGRRGRGSGRGRRLALAAALILAGGVSAAPPAAAQQSAAIRVIRDCGDDGRLDRTYSRTDLRSALGALPSDQEEYSYCRDAILAAQTAVRRPGSEGGPQGTPGSGASGGGSGAGDGGSGTGGAGSSGSSGGGAGSEPDRGSTTDVQPDLGTSSSGSDTGTGTGTEPDPPQAAPSAPVVPTGPTPEDLAELERAAGATIPPAALARAGDPELPAALVLALICLGVAAVLASAPLIHHIRPAPGRGPLAFRRR